LKFVLKATLTQTPNARFSTTLKVTAFRCAGAASCVAQDGKRGGAGAVTRRAIPDGINAQGCWISAARRQQDELTRCLTFEIYFIYAPRTPNCAHASKPSASWQSCPPSWPATAERQSHPTNRTTRTTA
jgi:hypothetical protein